MKTETFIISELPASRLLEVSSKLLRDDHMTLQVALMNGSPILNPAGSNNPNVIIFDLAGLKQQLATSEQCLVGAIANLRERWKLVEHQSKTRGKVPEQTLESASAIKNDSIAEAVIFVLVRQKEVLKLRKKVDEIESTQKASEQRRRLYLGSVKRARKDSNGVYQISMADGMPVDEKGIITDLGIHVDEYLAECRMRRPNKNGTRAA